MRQIARVRRGAGHILRGIGRGRQAVTSIFRGIASCEYAFANVLQRRRRGQSAIAPVIPCIAHERCATARVLRCGAHVPWVPAKVCFGTGRGQHADTHDFHSIGYGQFAVACLLGDIARGHRGDAGRYGAMAGLLCRRPAAKLVMEPNAFAPGRPSHKCHAKLLPPAWQGKAVDLGFCGSGVPPRSCWFRAGRVRRDGTCPCSLPSTLFPLNPSPPPALSRS